MGINKSPAGMDLGRLARGSLAYVPGASVCVHFPAAQGKDAPSVDPAQATKKTNAGDSVRFSQSKFRAVLPFYTTRFGISPQRSLHPSCCYLS